MMSELLKLKLEELTYDIAAAKCIAIEQSLKDVEALRGGGGGGGVQTPPPPPPPPPPPRVTPSRFVIQVKVKQEA